MIMLTVLRVENDHLGSQKSLICSVLWQSAVKGVYWIMTVFI